MMNGISSKIGGAALAGALTSIFVWIITSTTGVVIPPEQAIAISVVVSFVTGYFVPETATTNIEDATVKPVLSTNPADAAVVAANPVLFTDRD